MFNLGEFVYPGPEALQRMTELVAGKAYQIKKEGSMGYYIALETGELRHLFPNEISRKPQNPSGAS